MVIMIGGPYRHGADDAEIWKRNLRILNEGALKVFEKGHIPVIGVNLALPVIEVAGESRYQELMMPISLAIAERCDAMLRVGGDSPNADREVHSFLRRGLPVYFSIDDIPVATG